MEKAFVLVTGGAGFLGSHLCDALLEQYRVVALDNLATGSLKNIEHLKDNPAFEFIKHDLTTPLPTKLPPFQLIFNLACPASPPDYQRLPLETLQVSSLGLENLLRLAKKTGARLVHTSTSEVYGDPEVHPQTENYWGHVNSYGPRSCYDEGKRFGEALIYTYRNRFKVDTGIARIFNTYGPRMRADDGRVVSNFIVQALRGKALTIYGEGSQTRSFCYVSDQIDGLLKLAHSKEGGPINIGNPVEFTIKALAKQVLKLTGSQARLEYRPLPQDDPTQRCPDITLAKSRLGWEPKVMLAQGLAQTIEYFRAKA